VSTTIGPYEIRGRLGSGAMAVVWRGWDPMLEREVAIKEPMRNPGMTESAARELAERFVFEGRVAARLSHPGIVTVYAADSFDGRPAIVMEILRGHVLTTLIDKGGIPLPAALSIMDQVLDALGYAHSNGVVHRDVKPDNIIVSDDGRVKLTDFGVAHLSTLEVLGDRVIVGTPGYMSPEQIRAETVDARADIFSLGVVAYEMLTMCNPFGATDGLDKMSIMARTTNDPVVAFPAKCAVPREIGMVVLRALSPSAESRYGSAFEMREALRRATMGMSAGGSGAVAELVDDLQVTSEEVSLSDTTLGQRERSAEPVMSKAWLLGLGGVLLAVGLALVAGLAGGGAGVVALAAFAGVGGLIAWLLTDKATRSKLAQLAGVADSPEGSSNAIDSYGTGATDEGVVELLVTGPHDNRVERLPLPCVIGRGLEADLIIADERASRQHAALEEREGEVWLRDMGSRNGLLLDGALIAGEARVRVGSVVRVGSTDIEIRQLPGVSNAAK
jgi:tRNA A-37 threonylcarbamoyl transferase component Bud32